MRILNIASTLILSTVLLFGCMSTESKMKKFVDEYNKLPNRLQNATLRSTSASISSGKRINIYFLTKMASDDPGVGFIGSLIPVIVSETFGNAKLMQDLLDEGVSFEFIVQADDMKAISKTVIDKKKYEELRSQNKAAIASSKEKSGLGPELDNMLAILNKSLPYTDPSTGIIIAKIYIDKKALIYKGVVPDNLAESFKNPGSTELVKEGILSGADVKGILSKVLPLGVTEIRYLYVDSKENKLMEVPFTKDDFTGI